MTWKKEATINSFSEHLRNIYKCFFKNKKEQDMEIVLIVSKKGKLQKINKLVFRKQNKYGYT